MKALALLVSLAVAAPASAQVSYERILDAASEPGSWLTYSGSYGAQRYSTLDQIDRDNVDQLQAAWIYQTRSTQKFEVSPLVADGVMYITEPPSDATALDLRTGRPLWSYRRSLPQGIVTCCGQVNRGVALLDDQVFLGTVDAHLVALDARTGQVSWDIEVADHTQGYAITVAPLALDDKIIVGIAGGEYGIRGFLDAYDPTTGERLWRFWTVPGPGEPGNETWAGDSWQRGGAPTWVTGAYDPELDLLYWGTGNPGPDFIGEVREGDNLYSESVIALDPDTGELVWYFQFLPHDIHDYDATQVPVLADLEFEGEPRRLMLWPNRNAFYYVLDRVTGEFLIGKEFARQNWAFGLDEDGRPIENPETIADLDGAVVYPDDDGAANWFSPTYSPQTGLIYQNVRETGATYYLADATYEPGRIYMGASRRPVQGEDPGGFLRALNPLTGDLVWEIPLHTPPWAGLMSTAGGLVFSGTTDGDFFAADAQNGDVLWRFQTGGRVYANPITYLSEGRQFVTIAAGSSLFNFALPESTDGGTAFPLWAVWVALAALLGLLAGRSRARSLRTLPLVVGLLCFASVAQAQNAGTVPGGDGNAPTPLTAHRTGGFDAILPVRSPESEAHRWVERFQFPGEVRSWDYDLATESFSFYVPPEYDPTGEPYGVIVWVSAFDNGEMPPELRPVLDERRLIWIGPNNAGNARHIFPRTGLVLDAAVNVERAYNIDPDRIFVSGLSGGGKVAAFQAVAYPDVFAGGYPLIGMLTYLNVPLESSPGQLVQRFARPSEDLLERARQQPLVILTGSGDFNREECRLTAAAYERDGFTDLHLLDIDGMGHEMPSAENFARGLDLLLAPSSIG